MKTRSKGRKGEQEAREEWTERLQRFANARTAKQKQAAIEPALKINPGGALRDMLLAWGYSASARGRKPKGAKANGQDKTARERLEETLDSLFGAKPSPVRSLYAKLAGRADLTVRDACRIVAALVATWPEMAVEKCPKLATTGLRGRELIAAEAFVRELLSDLSGGRSKEWRNDDLAIRVFRLLDEERIGASQFIEETGEKEGALIVAGAKDILIGPDPVEVVRDFYRLTSQFVDKDHKGILIFVFDAAIFEAGREGFNLLYNIGLLSTAVSAFAIFSDEYDYAHPVQEHRVDWTKWRMLSKRCCVAVRKPTLVDPVSGELLKHHQFDEFVAKWQPEQEFTSLGPLRGFTRFGAEHVMPRKYPQEFRMAEASDNVDLYWDVTVSPAKGHPEGLEVKYYVPSKETMMKGGKNNEKIKGSDNFSEDVKSKYEAIEEDITYVIKKTSPGNYYDDAQRALYMAARGRLNIDSDVQHFRNLNAAAALRQVGYEVFPIAIMLCLFPRALYFAANANASTD